MHTSDKQIYFSVLHTILCMCCSVQYFVLSHDSHALQHQYMCTHYYYVIFVNRCNKHDSLEFGGEGFGRFPI